MNSVVLHFVFAHSGNYKLCTDFIIVSLVDVDMLDMWLLHHESKKQDTKLLAITALTIIRFSKFIH